MFDDGEDISHLIDWSSARQPGLELRRINVDMPDWMVRSLDVQAKKRGVARQALIKMWLADRLEAASEKKPVRVGWEAGAKAIGDEDLTAE